VLSYVHDQQADGFAAFGAPATLLAGTTAAPLSVRARVRTSRTNWRARAAGVSCAWTLFFFSSALLWGCVSLAGYT